MKAHIIQSVFIIWIVVRLFVWHPLKRVDATAGTLTLLRSDQPAAHTIEQISINNYYTNRYQYSSSSLTESRTRTPSRALEPKSSVSANSTIRLEKRGARSHEEKISGILNLLKDPRALLLGLEPRTLRLTAVCSANWATGDQSTVTKYFFDDDQPYSRV